MGQFCSTCNADNSSEAKQNINKVIISPFFPALTFMFTNSQAAAIPQNDCVIVDVLSKSIASQPYFSKLDPSHISAIQSEITLSKPGEIQVIENSTREIKVKDLIFLQLPVWKAGDDTTLENIVDGAIGEAVNMGHKTIIICDFQENLGIPINKSIRIILKILNRYQKSLTKLTLFSRNSNILNYFMKETEGFNGGQISQMSEF